ncbi:MAG TPA: hypothetical protein PKE31_05255 [Pseudomonadota bacterium]|nr:hypothetical protein [Pseudomonadota bacterium]
MQLFPTHETLQLGPQEPVHVEPAAQSKLQPDAPAEHASKAQVELAGHAQLVPTQTEEPQPAAHRSKKAERNSGFLNMG